MGRDVYVTSCTPCGGTGRVSNGIGTRRCLRCDGTGQRVRERNSRFDASQIVDRPKSERGPAAVDRAIEQIRRGEAKGLEN